MRWLSLFLCVLASIFAVLAVLGVSNSGDESRNSQQRLPTLEKVPATIGRASDPATDGTTAAGVLDWEQHTRARIHEVLSAAARIPDETQRAMQALLDDLNDNGYLPVSSAFVLMVVAGTTAERFIRRNRLHHWDGPEQYLPSLVFAAVVAPLYFLVDLPLSVRLVAGCYLLLFVAWRFVSALAEKIASLSFRRNLRLVMGLSLFTASVTMLGDVLDFDPDTALAIEVLASCMILTVIIGTTWVSVGRDARMKTAISLYAAFVWILWCLNARALFWLGIYPAILPPVLRAVSQIVRELASKTLQIPQTSNRTILLVRGARASVFLLALAWIAFVWETDVTFPGHGIPLVHDALAGVLRSALVLLVADIIWHLSKAAIERLLTRQNPSSAALETDWEGEHFTRLQTLLPILRNVLAVAILVVAGLTILGQIGVDIGPLITGAGIVGVAIGFGSQALVRDIISGFFYLFDDAFRVGEYIQAKDYRGTVEGFSLRSVKLRHHRGPIFTVPFGELGAVENMSRDWSKTKILVTVPYDTDLEKVRKIGKAIGQTLLTDPELGRLFIEPLKLKGVEDFAEYGIVVSFAMITVPTSQQSFIRRTAYASLRKSFQENGVTFAQPTVNIAGKDPADLAAANLQHQRSAPNRVNK